MTNTRIGAALAFLALASCHPDRGAEAKSAAAPDAALAGDARAEPPSAPAPDVAPPPPLGEVKRVLFSPKGELAFVLGESSFVVVDTRTGTTRRYRGEPDTTSILGFDNRCDVSWRGYMPNVDVFSVGADPEGRVFLRHEGDLSFRERVDPRSTLPLQGESSLHASAVVTSTEGRIRSFVPHGSNDVRPIGREVGEAKVIDSADEPSHTAIVEPSDVPMADGGVASEIRVDDLSTGLKYRVPASPGRLAEAWADFRHSLLVTVSDVSGTDLEGEGPTAPHERLCAHDLGAGASKPPACVAFAMPSPFFRMLVSPDGSKVAYTERVWGKPTGKNVEHYERDASRDTCFLHVLHRSTGKDVRWKSPCTTTTESPIAFEGDILVTDAARIIDCTPSVLRRYDVATGALRGQTIGPPPREDVDEKLEAAMKKAPSEVILHVRKQSLWAATYGHDELVAWSEGSSVLARRGASLVVCAKRGGNCGDPVAPIGEGAVGGASRDGSILGAASRGRFVAVRAAIGAKLVDVALDPGAP